MISLILGLYILGHVLYGYSKHRRLTGKAGEILSIGFGERPVWAIRINKKLPWWLSVIPLPWPLVRVWVMLEWWEYVPDESKLTSKITVKGKEELRYKETKQIAEGYMGLRKELVPSLRIYEHVNYDIEVATSDRYKPVLLLSFTFEVLRPMKTIELPSFKMLGNDQTNAQLVRLVNQKSVDDIYEINIDTMKELTVKVGNETLTLEEYLDQFHFWPLGFDLYKKGMKILETKEMDNYFKLKNKAKETDQKTTNAEKVGKLRETQRRVELEDANQEIAINKKAIEEVHSVMKPVIEDVYKGRREEKSARPYVLAEESHEADEFGEKVVETIERRVNAITKTTSSKKFEQEEVRDENQ